MAAVCASPPLAAASPPDSPSSCAACTKLQQEQHAQQQHRSGGVGAAAGAALAVVKPRFRGVMHSYACAAMLSAGALLVFEAPTAVARWCALVYVAAAAAQFFISSLYHTGHWSPAATSLLKKLDHSCIYVLIAATYTPVVAIPMAHDPVVSRQVLLRVWISALAGAVKTFAWPGAPRVLSSLTYVAMGWCAVPYFPLLAEAVDTHVVLLIVIGGVLYTVGAIIYATRYPDPFPATFGFHELFHTFVVAAAICHFAACHSVVAQARAKGLLPSPPAAGAEAAAAAAAAAGEDGLCWQRLVMAGA